MPLPAEHWLREAERTDVAVLHEQDLDVLAADVADHVDVAEVVRRAHHVGDGLDDVHVRLQAFFEHVGRVAGRAEAEELERRSLRRSRDHGDRGADPWRPGSDCPSTACRPSAGPRRPRRAAPPSTTCSRRRGRSRRERPDRAKSAPGRTSESGRRHGTPRAPPRALRAAVPRSRRGDCDGPR